MMNKTTTNETARGTYEVATLVMKRYGFPVMPVGTPDKSNIRAACSDAYIAGYSQATADNAALREQVRALREAVDVGRCWLSNRLNRAGNVYTLFEMEQLLADALAATADSD